MNRKNLVEIKAGEVGTGILIEHDGYISPEVGNNKQLFESYKRLNENEGSDGFHCPYPFIVDAVFQKYGIENANGRIYPEHVLKREVEKYQSMIKERSSIGECYRPEAMILTESGWKHLYEVSEGENIITLNTETNKIEIKPIKRLIKYHYDGNLINIKGRCIDDIVTPEHGYPVYNFKTNNFVKFITAKEILKGENLTDLYIPKIEEDIPSILLEDVLSTEVPYNGDVMCVEVENHVWYVMDNNKCHWTKNCNHPAESVIDLSRVAINIIELHWEGHTLVGKAEIIISEGFRRYGIISCQGDQVANLLLNGIKIGVSSRGLGSVTQKMGVLYVGDDFEIVCWDVVSSPSTPGAFISTNKEQLQQYIESDTSRENKPQLFEKLDKFNDWLND